MPTPQGSASDVRRLSSDPALTEAQRAFAVLIGQQLVERWLAVSTQPVRDQENISASTAELETASAPFAD